MNVSLFLIFSIFGSALSHSLSPAENQELQRICGTVPQWNVQQSVDSQRNIYGGIKAHAHVAPWAVGLSIENNFICSGTLISQRHVLTARHCVDAAQFAAIPGNQRSCVGNEGDEVVIGDFHGLQIQLPDGKTVQSTISKTIGLRGCQTETLENDVLIIELNSNIPLSSSSYPVCISKSATDAIIGGYVSLLSYGSTEFDWDTVNGLGVLRGGKFQIVGNWDANRLITYDPSQRFAFRQGDSGGGLVARANSGRITIFGIAAQSDTQWTSYGPNVGFYYSSICNHIGIC